MPSRKLTPAGTGLAGSSVDLAVALGDPAPTGGTVAAVLVAHDGARWLPEVLAALTTLTVRPDALVAVDTGSTDTTGELLRAALGPDAVVTLPRETGYPDAVAAGVAALQRDGAAPADWLWLLHDDAAPSPDCLQLLLEHAADSPSVALLGPKALDWYDPRVLVEVGVTTDRAGHRDTGLERRERDQGQHDAARDVLAVGTAGALVRREVWEEVGGLDPRLPLFRDELDLGWRVTSTGRRVVVVPPAVVRHARAATTGRRTTGAVAGRPTAVDRRHALLVLLAHASRRRLLTAVPALLVGQVLRALGHLLVRQVAAARDEAVAALAVLGRPSRLRAMRQQRRRLRAVPPGVVRPLLATRGGRLRARAEAAAGLLAGRSAPRGRRGDSLSEPVGVDDDSPGDDGAHPLRGLTSRPGALLVLGLALVALVAQREVLSVGGGLLQGGRLLPAPGGASDLWASYAATWSSTGTGTPAPAPPRTGVLAALSTVLLGKPWLAVDLLLLAGVPLAGLTAYLALRRHVASRLLRLWAAATWALLPVATGAVAAGRLDAAVVQVALPVLALGAVAVLRRDPRGAWHRVWALALGLSLVVAFAPSLWLVAAPLLVAGAVAGVLLAPGSRAGSARRRAGAAGIVLAVPPLLLLPWTLELVRTPGLLLHGPGRVAPDPALVDAALPAWHLLALSPGGAGLPPTWLGLGLLLPALAALVRPDRARSVVAAWSVALGGLLVALVLARTGAQPPTGGPEVAVWPGVPLQVAAAGLLAAALLGADGLRARLARVDFGARQVLAAGLAAVAVVLPLVAAGSWVLRGADDPLRRQEPPSVPAFAAAELDAAPGLRVLLLEPTDDGAVRYELVTGAGVRLGAADLPQPADQREAVDDVVADLVSARGSDAAAALSTRAVRYVALPRSAAEGPVAAALDAQAGLARRADDPVLLWEVLTPTARLVVLAPEAAQRARAGARAPATGDDVDPLPPGSPVRVPAGEPGRLLVLAEAADPGWRAELDGERLEPATAWDGVQAFALPAGGGTLDLSRDGEPRRTVLVLQAAAVALLLVLAAPGGTRRRGLEPAEDDVEPARGQHQAGPPPGGPSGSEAAGRGRHVSGAGAP